MGSRIRIYPILQKGFGDLVMAHRDTEVEGGVALPVFFVEAFFFFDEGQRFRFLSIIDCFVEGGSRTTVAVKEWQEDDALPRAEKFF